MRIYVIVEDTYAVEALRKLIKRIELPNEIKVVIKSLPICSNKMQRIVRAALKDYDKVIVIKDSECNDPNEVKEKIRENHLSSSETSKSEVIITVPCIEEWPCKALRLKNCDVAPCNAGPISSINEYWKRKHRRDYAKKYLPYVLEEAFSSLSIDELRNLSPSLGKLLKELLP